MRDNARNANAALFEAVAELGKLLGLSRSASMILGLLFVQDEPLSLDDVAESAGIAKSSVSVSLKHLEQMGLVEVADRLSNRRKFYKVVDNPGDALALHVARRLDNLTSRQQLPPPLAPTDQSPLQAARWKQVQTIYESLIQLAAFFRARRTEAWQVLKDCLEAETR